MFILLMLYTFALIYLKIIFYFEAQINVYI